MRGVAAARHCVALRLLARAGWMSGTPEPTGDHADVDSENRAFSADDEFDPRCRLRNGCGRSCCWRGLLCQAGRPRVPWTTRTTCTTSTRCCGWPSGRTPSGVISSQHASITTGADHPLRRLSTANIAEYVELWTPTCTPRHLAADRAAALPVLGMAEQIRTPLAGDGCGRVSTITHMEETLSLSSAEAGTEGAQSDVSRDMAAQA